MFEAMFVVVNAMAANFSYIQHCVDAIGCPSHSCLWCLPFAVQVELKLRSLEKWRSDNMPQVFVNTDVANNFRQDAPSSPKPKI